MAVHKNTFVRVVNVFLNTRICAARTTLDYFRSTATEYDSNTLGVI